MPPSKKGDINMPVYKDNKTGTFYAKFYYQDYTGQRKQKLKRGFKLQREAKEWERQFLERQQGTPSMSFQSLYDIYIEDMSHRLRQSTVDGKKSVFKNRILPYFKDKPVNEITPADIRSWQNKMISKEFSDGYLKHVDELLTTIFNYAVKYYNLPANPCDRSGHIGKRSKSLKFWTLDQYRAFISHVEDPTAHMAIELLFYGGMRFGELIALTYKDLDFENCTINIDKSAQRKASGDVVTPPKTENGIRVIYMPKTVMDGLREYTGRIYGLQDDSVIFTFTKHFIRNTMLDCCEASGVPFIRIHDLRHSHVSLLIELGFTVQLIAERIGDTVQLVLTTYGHLYPSKHQEVADKLNSIIVSK